MKIGDKVIVESFVSTYYGIGSQAVIIGKSKIDGYWLVKFPKPHIELHNGMVSAMHRVIEGKYSDRSDCLWVNQNYLERVG
jgi:hypothetical protein